MTAYFSEDTVRIIILIAGVLACIFFMRRGYEKGALAGIRSLLGILVAFACIFLIVILKNSVSEHTYSTAIVVGGAIVILSAGWKLTRMILDLLSGIKELPLIGLADRILGSILGAAECVAVFWIIYKVYERFAG